METNLELPVCPEQARYFILSSNIPSDAKSYFNPFKSLRDITENDSDWPLRIKCS
ncbi:hypothetical protein HK096_001661, partial [Nowakowskiella sp. JEL0078]